MNKKENKKRYRDIRKDDLTIFLRKMILGKGFSSEDDKMKSFWMERVMPLSDQIISIMSYNLESNAKNNIDINEFVTFLSLSISMPLELMSALDKAESRDKIENLKTPYDILNFCEQENPKFKTVVNNIGSEIFSDCITWLSVNDYISPLVNDKVPYDSLKSFLYELIESRQKKEPESEDWKSAFDLLEKSVDMVARSFYFSGRDEIEEPYKFAGGILGAISVGIVTNMPEYEKNMLIELTSKEKFDREEFFNEKLPEIWKKVLNELGPGMVWWMKDNMGIEINKDEIELVEGIGRKEDE